MLLNELNFHQQICLQFFHLSRAKKLLWNYFFKDFKKISRDVDDRQVRNNSLVVEIDGHRLVDSYSI